MSVVALISLLTAHIYALRSMLGSGDEVTRDAVLAVFFLLNCAAFVAWTRVKP